MRYRVLGAIAVFDDADAVSLGGPRQRLVLALLLRDVGRSVGDDAFVDALWPHAPPAGARHTLQTYISELRRVVDDEIQRVSRGYLLDADPDAVDAARFAALVDAGRSRLRDAPAGAAALLREALEMWHGEPYADLQDVGALHDEIHRLQRLRLEAVEDRVEADLAAGRHARVTIELEALARDHPYRERLHGLLMLALYRSSRQAEALRAYERARDILTSELGIDPSPALQRLQRQILEQDTALLAPAHDGEGSHDVPVVVRGFELRECVERRGPASVWRAYQPSASREVALTVIAAHEANSAAFIRSFEPIATRLAALDQPHLLPLLDYWRDPRGAYLVSPWARGGSVRATLRDAPWSVSAALRLVEEVGEALSALHHADLVHGDVGAKTVLLDGEGHAVLTPAGVVLRAAAIPRGPAPEVRHGERPRFAADVYGLACLAVEVLTGIVPDAETPQRGLHEAALVLPTPVVRVLGQGTAADPAERHPRVEDLVRELRRAIGADVVGLDGAEAGRAAVRNPYKGLRAFQEADADDFHGRERLVDELVRAVAAHRLVAVVGPSGCGKSSLVRAGLAPVLRRQGRLMTDMFPGAHPFEELEAALLRVAVDRPDGLLSDLLADERGLLRVAKRVLPADGELVLIIDQFEELYTLTPDRVLRRLFLESLVALAGDDAARVRTVVTLRADFFDRPLQHHAFGALVRDALVPIGMPSPQELARSIAQPAGRVGVSYEPGLVDTIVRDVADQTGGLPLLQHALSELFERREGRVLTAEAYRATGGVRGALGRRADELYASLPASAREVGEQVFLRLVTLDDSGETARRRARRAELRALEVDTAAVEEVIRVFGAHRILSFDHDPVTRTPTVEVAHEALFEEWEPLRGWIDARREDLLLHRRLSAAVAEWQHGGEAADDLLSGGRLDQFERWAATTKLALTARERVFLQASRTRQDDVALRQRRRRQALVTGLAAVALFTMTLAGLAFVQAQRARTGERIALSRELSAASRLQSAVDPDVSVLLALDAVEAARDAGRRPFLDALAALHEAVLDHRLLATVDAGGTLVTNARRDGTAFVSGPPSTRAGVWDLTTGEALTVLREDGRAPLQVAASADGRRAVETFVGEPTLVWDVEHRELLREVPATTPFQMVPAFGPDGQTLAVANLEQAGHSGNQTISLWDLDSGTERLRFPHRGNARDLAFSPDGRRLAVADMQNAVVRLYDTTTGDVVRVIGDPTDARGVDSVAFHPSGEQLAMFVFTPRELRIVDLPADEVVASIPLGTAPLGARLCYSGDGDALVVATEDSLLNVYDAAGVPRLALPGSKAIDSLVCGDTGDQVIHATDDGRVRVWGLGAQHAGEVLSIATPPPFTGVWEPTRDAFLTTHYGSALVPDPDLPTNGTLHRYDADSGRLLAEIGDLHPFPPWWIQVSPDGRWLAANADPYTSDDPSEAAVDVPRNARLVIHDAVTLERLREVDDGGWALGFSADSTRLLAGGMGGARVIDVGTGADKTELAVPGGDEQGPETGGGAFVDGDRHVVLLADPREGWIIDVRTGAVTAEFCRGGGGGKLAVSPDRNLVAVSAGPGTTEVWDVATLLRGGGASCDEASGEGLLHVLDGDPGIALTFDPQGRMLAAAGFDGVLTVWDVRTGESHLRLEHDGQIGGASFSRDGRHLLVTVNDAGGTQHAVRVYTLDPDELVAVAEARVTRALTPEECAAFLPHDCP